MTLSKALPPALLALVVAISAGCHKGPYDGLDSKLKADYEKAAKENEAFKKLPLEEQIQKIQSNPNMPDMYKQAYIAKLKAQSQQKR